MSKSEQFIDDNLELIRLTLHNVYLPQCIKNPNYAEHWFSLTPSLRQSENGEQVIFVACISKEVDAWQYSLYAVEGYTQFELPHITEFFNMKTFKIPVIKEYWGLATVDATSLTDALDKVMDGLASADIFEPISGNERIDKEGVEIHNLLSADETQELEEYFLKESNKPLDN